MFKIGDFSQLSQVSVKTLHHYDAIGLFKPAHIDPGTGYRFYTAEQLVRLNRILILKDLGFSLEQVATLLDAHLSSDQLRGMLQTRQAELAQHIAAEQARLTKIAARLQLIEQEGKMPSYEVILKQVEPTRVASIRQTIPTYMDIGPLIGELYTYLAAQNVKPGISGAIWHDPEYRDHDVDTEALVFIEQPAPETERVRVYELPSVQAATAVHHGSYATLNQVYGALAGWIEQHGYTVAGSPREVYLQMDDQGNENHVTEVQFPVTRAAA